MQAEQTKNNFRDVLATIESNGKRKWVYPKKPSGTLYNARTLVSVFLLAILFGIPFINVHGHPLVLLNVLERSFILFGIPFGPHDFHLFVIAMIAIVVFVILFTVVYGRIFCGWVCPQTVFMEMVFRKIEYLIEGNASWQRQLNVGPWTSSKILKKSTKHVIFFLLSFIISNFFLAYIIGMDQLMTIITDPPAMHIAGLTAIMVFSLLFYWVFSNFREQACTIVCPYGRLQGVLLDQDSIVIAYDNFRGEPRGRIRKDEDQSGLGDCIDCDLCVDVCPTGIDIRNGIQLECINCAACIDECNKVMEKVKRKKGLIRYDSLKGIENKERFSITPRIIFYSIILVLLVSLLSYLLVTRSDYSINVFRTPGLLFQKHDDGRISNIYDLNFINKTFDKLPVSIRVEGLNAEVKTIGENFTVEPQGMMDAKFLVTVSPDQISKMNNHLTIKLFSGKKEIGEVSTTFLAPYENIKVDHKKEEYDED